MLLQARKKPLTEWRYFTSAIESQAPSVDLSLTLQWVREFFHPETLKEICWPFEFKRRK
jgi:hypothetical protein